MTWEIVLGMIALTGFVGSVTTWISKLAKALGILESTIQTLNKVLDDMKAASHETHKDLFRKYNDHDRLLSNHEGRIRNLEKRKGEAE